MYFIILLFFSLPLFALEQERLIEGVIDPLTGAPLISETDLIAKGAESLTLTRTLIPHEVPSPLHQKKKHVEEWNTYFLYKHLSKHYKGWENFPNGLPPERTVLPNGRVIRAFYENSELVRLEARSPNEEITYSSISFSHRKGEKTFTTSSSQTAIYKYEILPVNLKFSSQEEGPDELELTSHFPPRLVLVTSPFFKEETIEYTKEFYPKKIVSKNKHFHFQYKKGKVHKLFVPTGHKRFELLCEIDYEAPIKGSKEGKTLVKYTNGKTKLFTFSKELLPKEVKEENESVEYEYLPKTNLPTVKRFYKEGALVKEERLKYDKYHNLIEEITWVGSYQEKKITYHLRESPPFIHMPEMIETKMGNRTTRKYLTYDVWGNICHEELFLEDGTRVLDLKKTYNERGDLLQEIDTFGRETVYMYDLRGNEIFRKTVEGNIFTKAYDPMGRIVEEAFLGFDGLKKHTFFKYDLFGHLIEKSDHLGRVTKFTYDPLTDKLLQIEHPPLFDGSLAIEDLNENEEEETTPFKEALKFQTVDSLHRPTVIHPPLSFPTITTYEEYPIRLKKTLFPNGTKKVETLDLYDRTVKEEIFNEDEELIFCKEFLFTPFQKIASKITSIFEGTTLLRKETTSYKYLNKRVVEINNKGKTTHFTYTEKGLLKSKTFPNGVALEYDYNDGGLLKEIKATDHSVHYRYNYNEQNRLTQAIDCKTGLTLNRELSQEGYILKEIFPNQLPISKTYDEKGQKKAITLPDGSVIQYDNKVLSRISEKGELFYQHTCQEDVETLIYNLGEVKKTFDKLGRITNQASPYFQEELHYDYGNQLLLLKEKERVVQFRYDPLGYLTDENHKSSKFDSNGNRINYLNHSILLNEFNRPIKLADIECQYDLNDRLIFKKTKGKTFYYQYDALDRLIRVDGENKTILFTYDPLGRLMSREVLGGKKELFLFDDFEEIGLWEGMTPKVLKILNQNKISAIEIDGVPFSPLIDFQGNVRGLIDPKTHEITKRADFSQFGEPSKNFSLPYGFKGARFDFDCGFYHLKEGLFDPHLALFIEKNLR